jgi:alkaline phosphatase
VTNSRRRRALASVATVSAATLLLTTACSSGDEDSSASSAEATHAEATPAASSGELADRAAEGDITTPGGARRLDGDQTDFIRGAMKDAGAKNVILLIGDGMGDSEITAARNYAEGAAGQFKGLDALPVSGQYTHYSLNKDGSPDYVTDSAASGTAWATGTKTYNGAIGVDIHGAPHENLIEKAKAAGLATGNVTTSEIQDATPAVQAAHVAQRKCYGPEDAEACGDDLLDKGGKGSISEQLLETRADVTLGGGSESFDQTAVAGEYKGKTLIDQAKERGYQLPKNADELAGITSADQDAPVLGLFSEGNMPVRWEGKKAEKEGYLQPAEKCTDNPERTAEIPKLADMTSKAIDLLSANPAGKDKGFFLQVEGASIDKQDHAANPCGQIGETVDLDEAVQKALEFAQKDGDTLVIVTADHAHTSQIVAPVTEEDVADMAKEAGVSVDEARATVYPGLSRNLTTKDGSEMTVAYATSDNQDVTDQGHTGTQLRIAAYGPGAANVTGLTDQTDLHFTVADALGLK